MLDIKGFTVCQHCGGQVLPDYDEERVCLQCARLHTKDGMIITPHFMKVSIAPRTRYMQIPGNWWWCKNGLAGVSKA